MPIENLQWLSLVIALLGMCVILMSDNLQSLAKFYGASRGEVAGGYNRAMKVMVLNRVGAVLFFLLMALNIDMGIKPNVLIKGFTIAALISCLPAMWMLYVLYKRQRTNRNREELFDFRRWPKVIFISTFIAALFNLMGLTLPLLAGAIYPEFRLTFSNTSFLFNTVYTVINVFYIEHHFARIIDQKSENAAAFIAALITARFGSFMVFGLIFAASI